MIMKRSMRFCVIHETEKLDMTFEAQLRDERSIR